MQNENGNYTEQRESFEWRVLSYLIFAGLAFQLYRLLSTINFGLLG
jgi:hypothetical protein